MAAPSTNKSSSYYFSVVKEEYQCLREYPGGAGGLEAREEFKLEF
jgi:hypothetical protein